MGATILVEPYPGGHRSQFVAFVAEVAARTSDVLILTSKGGSQDPAFVEELGDTRHRVQEVFSTTTPQTGELAREIAAICRDEKVDSVVGIDAGTSLKRWWLDAPRAFGLRRRPQVAFLRTRYASSL